MAHTPWESASHPEVSGPPRDQPLLVPQRKGCLFALAQLPLIIFLGFVSTLLILAALHDLVLL